MRKHLLIVLLILLITGKMTAQNVTGTVVDEQQMSIPGVTVVVKGTEKGTVTDVDGKFEIKDIPNASAQTLVFSSVGFTTKEQAIGNNTTFNIVLQENSKLLNEVVVVGYGTMRRKDLTGAVTQIRPDRYVAENPKTVQDILRGTPGLAVSYDASAKGGGNMQIRGARSVYTKDQNGNSRPDLQAPLIVLDGMIFYGELSEINPSDIGQIDILKDASAAAIYGAQSANGVIIITTKKGALGKPVVNINSNFSFSTMAIQRKTYDPAGYLNFYEDWFTQNTYGMNTETGKYEAYVGKVGDARRPGYYSNPANVSKWGISLDEWRALSTTPNPEGATDNLIWATRLGLKSKTLEGFLAGQTFDWYDHTFQTGFNQDHNVSVSGASDKMNYYMSLGYLDNQGVVVGNNYKAIRSNLKVEGNVNKWLSIGANVNFQNRSDGDLVNRDANANWIAQIRYNSPFAAYRDADGNLTAFPMTGSSGFGSGYNADFDKQYIDKESAYTILNTIFSAKVKLPFNITYTFNGAPRYQWFYNRYWESSAHPAWTVRGGYVERDRRNWFNWSLNNTLNWEYTFARKHHINLTLAQEAEEKQSWQDRIRAEQFEPSDALGFHKTDNGNQDKLRVYTNDVRESADALLARLFYSYDDKYMVTGTVRRDGYSGFGTSNPRATFYSAGLAWTFSNEKFFRWEPMSNGKVRLSWGENGNRSLENPYLALADLASATGTQGYWDATGNYILYQALRINRMANPNLKWERSNATNIGLDLGFLRNRFNATVEYYNINTDNMIMSQTLPGFSGFTSMITNLGEVQNKGFELTIQSQNIKNNNFEWNTTFGFSKNKNTILHLYYEWEDVLDATGNVISSKERDDITNNWFIGQPVSAIWNYKVTGIWQVNEYDEAKRYGQRPGDPKVENFYTANDRTNADGSVTPIYDNNDKQFLGQTDPPIRWSLRNDFTLFKNLDISINIYSLWGHKAVNTEYLNRNNTQNDINLNFNQYKAEYWTLDNPTNKYARLDAAGPAGVATPGKLYDRSFIRLDNISVAYTLPSKWTSKFDVQKLKVFCSIRNAALWTKEWKLWDPETYTDYNPGSTVNGTGFASRVFSIGLNITL